MTIHRFKIFIWALAAALVPISSNAQRGLYIGENVPITLYGKVVDQYGEPVPAAKVSFLIIITYYAMNSGEHKEMTLETDQLGQFIITGITGHAIDKISIDKAGYELSKKGNRGFSFGLPHSPPETSLEKPAIFKMWKLTGKDTLVTFSWHGGVICNGTTNRFDLVKGRLAVEGSLEIVCTRSALPPLTNGHFGYTFRISIADGGIQPTEDEFTYLAPEGGYAASVTIHPKADAPDWRPNVKQEFYIKTKEGYYGRLFVEWYAWQTPKGHCE